MRTIKFRGRDIETGRTVYGGFVVGRCGQPLICANVTAAYEVDPDTVEQLVGYDADGKEVYEGDELCSVDPNDPNPYTARLDGFGTIQGEHFPRFAISKFRLKEGLK